MSDPDKIVQLYSAEQVQRRLDDLARCLRAEYEWRDFVLIGVLNGGRTVTQEIARRLGPKVVVDYVKASSYGNGTRPDGRVRVDLRTREPLAGRHVLLVDDIVDTGQTLAALLTGLKAERLKSIRTLVLANKPLHRVVHVPLDYVGFTVPNKFIVGCGMGRGEEFRDLPFLGFIETTK